MGPHLICLLFVLSIIASAIFRMEISGKRRQKVHIEYDLVGYIPVDELLKAEQA